MTVLRQGRTAWTTRTSGAPRQGTVRKGVALHWPGMVFPIDDHQDCLDLLDRLERNALRDTTQGYTALPYCQAACLHGYLIEGRGADRRSGANGSATANLQYGSVVALIPAGQQQLPRPMLAAIRQALIDQAPRGKLLTHAQVRPQPTACPGPALTAWISDGAHVPPPPAARTHVVQTGDTLWALAQRYLGDGKKWEVLAEANGITNSSQLSVGQTLWLP